MSTETSDETIARLTESNRKLANQIVGYGDHIQATIAGIVKDAKVEALREAAAQMATKWPLALDEFEAGEVDDWLRTRADNLEAS